MTLSEAIRGPTHCERWVRRWLLGGCLLLLAPLVLPLVLVLGYLVRVRRTGMALPAWPPFGPLFGDGARLGLALLVYGWPALLSLGTLPAGALFLGPWASWPLAPWALLLADGAQPLGLAWLLVTFLLAPLLLLRVAESGSLAQALSPRALLRLARAVAGALPLLWLKRCALVVLSLAGLMVALVGFPFAAFWALTVAASLTTDL